MSELFDAVDALLASRAVLPPPAERKRLRAAHGLTIDEVATALKVRRATVSGWESGKTEPRPPERDAYARLLDKLAELYPAVPADTATPDPDPDPAPAVVPAPFAAPAPAEAPTLSTGPAPETPQAPAPVAAAPAAAPRPARTTRPSSTSRRPGAKKAAPAGTPAPGGDPRFENGPLAVVDAGEDGQVVAYCTGGLVLDVPAKSLPSLVDWTLKEARLGQSKLSGPGRSADPLLVLTEAACERYGLPVVLSEEERSAGRIPEGHKVVKQLVRTEWKLTQRGFGPWARIYRPATGSERACVQLCIPSWGALDPRHWGSVGQLPPAELARVLGVYASRVMTPRGSTAVTGLELMTALHPPTRASEPDAQGKRHSEHNPGSLGKDPIDLMAWPPCEVPDGHPALKDLPKFHVRGPNEQLFEESMVWARPMTDAECTLRYLVGLDVNMAFGAGANGLAVGLGAPTHVKAPVFDPKLPGSWLVDLSHVDLSRVKVAKDTWADLDSSLLPSPFTPKGEHPTGPAWYATPTVAYAQELGYDVAPLEAWVQYDNGRYLDGWYQRLRDAHLATMADLGVDADLSPEDFLAAMDGYKDRDPELALVLSAIKATAKGSIGKMRERPRGENWRPGEPWRALSRPTWRPDIRAAVISRTRINLHRKIVKHAAFTGQYPIAVNHDCVVYASNGPSPLDFLPYRQGKPLPGGFKLGINPGLVKHEGTQTVLWGEQVREKFNAPELNLARFIKDGEITNADNGE
ncbi:telomere-associated protein Tap [Streptomyces hydrogenans]|uniref:Transcriptional regulator n=3 Tax=Streptomyces hydrogenans TaxID=1873719 RepID=A0ABQ3PLN9_9ACTN|nr:helix-turn-helix transcriptional regulator [Streptomyces hydrogenans]GHE24204.1 transcriptional regulator [Streptomyces hydrogenans]GHI24530.1 transcriptional regulator [Streptomyces hydrogenans]GHI25378.1 transcriptional regulator [Streptomyces hydrogenans]GHI25912.1 transcriptional regulator [Streptomyces hydrogenans]GHI26871.1 transcriptional regulator [Streptomyces hydrogenans]